jgi:hypothetical protein
MAVTIEKVNKKDERERKKRRERGERDRERGGGRKKGNQQEGLWKD